MSSLRISPEEQVRFIRGVLDRRFPISAHAYEMIFAILPAFPVASGWTARGKTGSGTLPGPAGKRSVGWFVTQAGFGQTSARRVGVGRECIGASSGREKIGESLNIAVITAIRTATP